MKQCKIYYATVVSVAGKWSTKGDRLAEPVEIEDRPALGKSPEYCCTKIAKAIKSWVLYVTGDFIKVDAKVDAINLCFCPFCGAKIVYEADLELREVETYITCHTYHFEENK